MRSTPTFGAAIDEHSGVHALDSDEKLSVLLEFVLVSEDDFGERCATARVVNNVLNDALDVSANQKSQGVRHSNNALFDETYPLRSAKSSVLKAAGATLLEV